MFFELKLMNLNKLLQVLLAWYYLGLRQCHEVLANSPSKTEANTVVAQMKQTTAIYVWHSSVQKSYYWKGSVGRKWTSLLRADSAFSASDSGPDHAVS